MEKQLLQVRAFQAAFDAPMPEKPTLLDNERANLRQKLLQEEVTEIENALNSAQGIGVLETDKTLDALESISDGIVDAMYILLGTAHEYGIADRLPLMFDEVHSANVRKLGPDGKPIYREDGKVLKPEGWTPPNLKVILNRKFHLYNDDNATFSKDLRAIQEAETKRFHRQVEREIFKRLKWYDRILPRISQAFELVAKKLEAPTKRKVRVVTSTDDSYRGVAEIEVYGERFEVVDY
jgi:predicted HAD superfamily Cof-like phosphohydrolase